MSVRRVFVTGLVTTVGGSLLAVLPLAAPAGAAVVDPAAAAAALDLPAGVTAVVSGSSATSATAFNDFPSTGSSYLVLSTGDADAVFGAHPTDQLSTDVGGDSAPDTASVTLTVAPGTKVGSSLVNAGCLFVDFAMGTEERVHTYTDDAPSDRLSVRVAGSTTEYAMNTGRGYFSQGSWPAAPKPYEVNAISYWHQPGDPNDPLHGTTSTPRLAPVTGLNHFTTRDTARIPIDVSGATDVTLSVADAANGDLDSVALVDKVRVEASCSSGTGVEPADHSGATIRGKRQVGSVLTYDPVKSTELIERYDSTPNGWRSPSGTPVELRFRWYHAPVGSAANGDMSKWIPLNDADRQSYVPTETDQGKVIIVLVTGVVDGRRYETFPSTATTNDPDKWFVTTPIDAGQFDPPAQLPTIDAPAVPRVGDVLTAQVGNTSPKQDNWVFQWYVRSPGSTGTSAITGQTGLKLQLSSGQVGKEILVKATAERAGFTSGFWWSPATAAVQLIPLDWPGEPAVPTIEVDGETSPDGEPIEGAQLTANPGVGWPDEVTEWTYQWHADGEPVANGQNHTVEAADAGKALTVVVRGAPPGYTPLQATSAPTRIWARPFTSAPEPTIDGLAEVGKTLTATTGSWAPEPGTFTYQWKRNGENIASNATAATYVLKTADAGTQVTVVVTATKSGYRTLELESAPVSILGQPMVGALPTITGTARVGSTLVGSASGWQPGFSSLTYSWYAGSTLLQQGTSRTLTVPAGALGRAITLRVRGIKSGYQPLTRISAATAATVRGTLTSGAIRLSGTVQVGRKIRAYVGAWRPSPVALTYRWKIGKKYVAGAKGRRTSLKIPKSARRKKITVVVTGTKPGFTTVVKKARTAKVK